MSEYHVGAGFFGIYCGKLNKDGTKWTSKTECTDEAIEAVRDYLKLEADSQRSNEYGFEWTTKDGKKVRLLLEVTDA